MATQTIGGYAVGTVMPSGHVVGGTSASAQASIASDQARGINTSSTATAPITSATLTPTTQPTIPTATTIPTSQTTGVVTANNQALTPSGFTTDSNGIYTPKEQVVVDSQTKLANDRINALMNNPQPNLENLYNTTRQQTGVDQAQQAVNTYTGQLNTITANSQAAQLAVTGQGRGIPETILGGQQAEIAKEAAINALPIQALLATAQGNLQMAQSNLDTLFSIKSKDAENTYSFNTSMINAVYDFADKQQQNLLDTLKTQQAQAYATQQAFLKSQATAISNATFSHAPASVITAINNATDEKGLAIAAGSYGVDPSVAISAANLKINQQTASREQATWNATYGSFMNSDGTLKNTDPTVIPGYTKLPNGQSVIISSVIKANNVSGIPVIDPATSVKVSDATASISTVNQMQTILNQVNSISNGDYANRDQSTAINDYKTLLSTLPKEIQVLLPISPTIGGINNQFQFTSARNTLNQNITSVAPNITATPYGQIFTSPQSAQSYFTSTGQTTDYTALVAKANALAQSQFKRDANDGEILQVINGQ